MRNLKQVDFKRKKRMRSDDFAAQNYKRIRRRVNDFADRRHSSMKPRRKRQYKKKAAIVDDIAQQKRREGAGYHSAEETSGKKDPETPKKNPKIGQFQQSPVIPMSSTPDVKTKKTTTKSNRLSGFGVFRHKKQKQLQRKYRNTQTVTKAAAKMWRELPEEEKHVCNREANMEASLLAP